MREVRFVLPYHHLFFFLVGFFGLLSVACAAVQRCQQRLGKFRLFRVRAVPYDQLQRFKIRPAIPAGPCAESTDALRTQQSVLADVVVRGVVIDDFIGCEQHLLVRFCIIPLQQLLVCQPLFLSAHLFLVREVRVFNQDGPLRIGITLHHLGAPVLRIARGTERALVVLLYLALQVGPVQLVVRRRMEFAFVHALGQFRPCIDGVLQVGKLFLVYQPRVVIRFCDHCHGVFSLGAVARQPSHELIETWNLA